MTEFSKLVGKKFKRRGMVFEITSIDSYPEKRISKRYKEIIEFRPDLLVAIDYRGTLIPNITVKGGVVRITGIRIGNTINDKPGKISEALKINKAMYAYKITKI